jgi:hypothetical protein
MTEHRRVAGLVRAHELLEVVASPIARCSPIRSVGKSLIRPCEARVGRARQRVTHEHAALARTQADHPARLRREDLHRLISLSDPDARPIRKGKVDKPNEFGYVAQIAEVTRTPSAEPAD